MLIWNTVSGRQNLPRDGDRIWHKARIGGVEVNRIGIVRNTNNILTIYPAYTHLSNEFAETRIVTDGLVWALSERKEKDK